MDRNVLVGSATSDDAGVIRLSDDVALILTTDFFTPMVDDPFDFGRIAAANALSDVYAMGGTPFSALNITGFPPKGVESWVLTEILKGGHAVAKEAGIEIVGGHTVKTDEPLYGLSVVGTVHPDRIVTNAGARPGDRLVITKPIGNALITTAHKKGKDRIGAMEISTGWMTTLNRAACEAMVETEVKAATDITGFGLLGHMLELLDASGCGAVIHANDVPLLPGALEYAAEGFVCGGSAANRKGVEESVEYAAEVDETIRIILNDAQTSGGLLIAVRPEREEELLAGLKKKNVPGSVIGDVVVRGEKPVRVI